jgi:hypothetical protein
MAEVAILIWTASLPRKEICMRSLEKTEWSNGGVITVHVGVLT